MIGSSANTNVCIVEEIFKNGNATFFSDQTFFEESVLNTPVSSPSSNCPTTTWEYIGYVETAFIGLAVLGAIAYYYGKTHGWFSGADNQYINIGDGE